MISGARPEGTRQHAAMRHRGLSAVPTPTGPCAVHTGGLLRATAGPYPQAGSRKMPRTRKGPGPQIPGRSHCAEGVTAKQTAN